MTVYNLLKEAGLPIKQSHIGTIGKNIRFSARALNVGSKIIEQHEAGNVFAVHDYPDSFIPRMQKIVGRFYKKQASKILVEAK